MTKKYGVGIVGAGWVAGEYVKVFRDHPLTEVVPPCWESKSDWEIFKSIAKKVSELATVHLPEPFKDIVASPRTTVLIKRDLGTIVVPQQ